PNINRKNKTMLSPPLLAETYVAKCIWAHNPHRGLVGESMFAITEDLNIKEAVKAWHSEIRHFSFQENACTPNKVCGHYTQIVWADTDKLACAKHFCLRLQKVDLPHTNVFLCNYSPIGNIAKQKPYIEGLPCSACPREYFCEDELCSEYLPVPRFLTPHISIYRAVNKNPIAGRLADRFLGLIIPPKK
uniref:SCP domain-containing protein n=1 Tax=Callorhinchus milii TaxID=7868 RepID=A0A4W3GGG5_CALMI